MRIWFRKGKQLPLLCMTVRARGPLRALTTCAFVEGGARMVDYQLQKPFF